MLRVVLAFLVAPALGTLLVWCVPLLIEGRTADPFFSAMVSLSTLSFGYPTALLVGLPLFLCMYRMRCVSLLACIGAALVCALALWLLVGWGLSGHSVELGVFIALCATVGGVAFWAIGV